MSYASKRTIEGVLVVLAALLLSLPCFAMDTPETIEIDTLAQYYAPVEFDHELHVDLAEDCSVCHHHTTGTGTTDLYCAKCHSGSEELARVACADCHSAEPFSAAEIHRQSQEDLFHVDMNGLMGAYHQNCLGCHAEMGGPAGCQDCHSRNEAGDELYHAGEFAPSTPERVASH